jgi:hypothetical protein
MATKRKDPPKLRGVYQKVKGPNMPWWISYKSGIIRKREKIGTRGEAIIAYADRKAKIRAGENLRSKGVTFGEIAKDAEAWYALKKKKDIRNVTGRMKFLVKEFGEQPANKIAITQIDFWIGNHKKWSAGTCNRYKALMSKTYKLALAVGKVSSNPARLVEHRPESEGRIRWMAKGER